MRLHHEPQREPRNADEVKLASVAWMADRILAGIPVGEDEHGPDGEDEYLPHDVTADEEGTPC